MTSTPPLKVADDQKEILSKIENLAAAQYRNGKFLEAAELLRKALSIREQSTVDKDSVDSLSTMNNLAASLGRLKQFDEAELLFRHVLVARESSLGPNHIETLMTANYLGVIVKQLKKLEEAEELVYRALSGFQIIVMNGCPCGVVYAETAYNYAVILVQLGKRKKAGKYFGIAYRGLVIELGNDNPHALDALDWEIRCMSGTNIPNSNSEQCTAVPDVVEGNVSLPNDAEGIDFSTDAVDGISDTDDREVYLSRPTWQNKKNCNLCNTVFKVSISFCFVYLFLLRILTITQLPSFLHS
jgi:tetratricopeptide (TPR) repeat protein